MYALPQKYYTLSSTDELIIPAGKSLLPKPDHGIVSNWDAVPKNFTMFAVKYVNPYHGSYFHRGRSTVTDATGGVVESSVHHQQFLEKDEVWSLETKSRNQVVVEGAVRATAVKGKLNLLLTFSVDNCAIESAPGSAFTITGTGKFLDNAGEWGNKKRDAIYLNYQFTEGANKYSATDTLVIRDRAVSLENFQPVVSK